MQVQAEGAVPAAQELHLTGCAVAAKDSFAVVVVEGGPKALKFYKKLMLQRMKWHITVEEEKARAEGEDADDEPPAAGQGELHAAPPLLQLQLKAMPVFASVVYPSTACWVHLNGPQTAVPPAAVWETRQHKHRAHATHWDSVEDQYHVLAWLRAFEGDRRLN